MRNYYLGGACRGGLQAEPLAAQGDLWQSHGAADLFLDVSGEHFELYRFPDLALFLRGYATLPNAARLPTQEEVARTIHEHYRRHRDLPVDALEGSFTIALLDGRAGRVVLYRNLVGSGFTYYCATPSGLLFSSNLADLVEARGVPPRPNEGAIPAFFLYRCVPGRETLFDGVYRLMPGELVVWDVQHGLGRGQRQTLDDLRQAPRDGDAVDLVDETLGRVVADCSTLRPGMANLLSGGVDSTYLQILWDRAAGLRQPPSFSVSVNDACGRGETEYARSASEWLGTRHTLVPLDRPYADYLLDTLATTAEPLNHVQTAYFSPLAQAMSAHGVTTGLCGEGADNLFGVASATHVQYARILQRLLPAAALRGVLARLASLVGWGGLRECAALANRLGNWSDLQHPVNQVSAFTDWDAVHACFGARTVASAAAYRRRLLTEYRVASDPLEAMHAMGYLADAMDTAAMWTTVFNREGGDLLCPFMDSRLMRLMFSLEMRRRYPFREPKGLLKRALARVAPREFAYRPKRGFGQPIFDWLAPGGQLHSWVEAIAAYPFVDRATLTRVKARPTWFLYSLLCYDLWHKLFIERSIPHKRRRQEEPVVA